jgi:hypothetical protein
MLSFVLTTLHHLGGQAFLNQIHHGDPETLHLILSGAQSAAHSQNMVNTSPRTTPTLAGRRLATRRTSREGAAASQEFSSKPRKPPATRQPRRRGGRRAEVPVFANKQHAHTSLSRDLTIFMQTELTRPAGSRYHVELLIEK